MRKYLYLLLVISLTFCTSNTTDEENEVTTTSQNVVTTVVSDVQPIPEDTTPQYIFDIEKMSPLTGKEISQEEWLLRPKRVLAFKVDNNINARPQSGLELSDVRFNNAILLNESSVLHLFQANICESGSYSNEIIEKYDTIVIRDVIEHIEDKATALTNIFNLLH